MINTIGNMNATLGNILSIVVLIVSVVYIFLMYGYGISVIRNTINHIDEIPSFEISKNLVDGIKTILIGILYYIIPIVVIFAVLYYSGDLVHFATISYTSLLDSSGNLTNTYIQNNANSVYISLFISGIVSVVLIFVTSIFAYIGIARFADKGKIMDAFQIKEILNIISTIKWSKYIILLIIYFILSFCISAVFSLVSIIPYIGIIISILVIFPYLFLFCGRVNGLIYNEANPIDSLPNDSTPELEQDLEQ